MPSAVRKYMPTRRPRSVQWKPQPQRKKGAATTPRRGTVMATSVTNRTAGGARSGAASRRGDAAAESPDGDCVSSDTTTLLSDPGDVSGINGAGTSPIFPSINHGDSIAKACLLGCQLA